MSVGAKVSKSKVQYLRQVLDSTDSEDATLNAERDVLTTLRAGGHFGTTGVGLKISDISEKNSMSPREDIILLQAVGNLLKEGIIEVNGGGRYIKIKEPVAKSLALHN